MTASPRPTSRGPVLSRQVIGLAAAILVVNAFVCRKLFITEYTRHMDSIEGAYIGLSRYIMAHWSDLSWYRLWYCGIPFHNCYPPVLHVLVAAFAGVTRVSPALAHHAVGATFYCLGPVTFFLLCYRLSDDRVLSFIAGMTYSLISPSAFMMRSVSGSLGSLWRARRLQTLVAFGDGPHVAALALVPLALVALDAALEKRSALRTCSAAVVVALVVLTNWLGAFALAMAVLSYLLARFGEPQWTHQVARSAGIGLLAYALACPWIPPSTIADIRRNSEGIGGYFPMGWPQLVGACLVLLAALGLLWVFRRWKLGRVYKFGMLFLLFTAALVLPMEWHKFYLLPQPDRYQLEMELPLCMVLVFGIGALWAKIPKLARTAGIIVLICAALIQVRTYSRFARSLIQPIQIEKTIEYETARWLDRTLPDQRVFAIGSVQFWLNAFGNNPQLGGGFGQGITNPEITVAHFGVPFTEHDGSASATWLGLFGVRALIVSGPDGRDAYHYGWRDPAKFRDVLPVLWRDGGDVIYGIAQRSPSLAYVIPSQAIVARPPLNVLDAQPVGALAAALRDSSLPVPEVTWQSPHEALIRAVLAPHQVLFVQMSYHRGWRAFVDGRPQLMHTDGLGLTIIEPQCDTTECEVNLVYDGSGEMMAARCASIAALGFMVVWCGYSLRKRQTPAS